MKMISTLIQNDLKLMMKLTTFKLLSYAYLMIFQKLRKILGPFNFGTPIDDGIEREKRPIVMIENGAKYEGEWYNH